MIIQLFLDLNNLEYYGHIPEVPDNPNGRVEEFTILSEDDKYIENDIDDIDSVCGALLDVGDVEFFNAEQCSALLQWIENRIEKPIDEGYQEILNALKGFCQRAIELNTGIVIEL